MGSERKVIYNQHLSNSRVLAVLVITGAGSFYASSHGEGRADRFVGDQVASSRKDQPNEITLRVADEVAVVLTRWARQHSLKLEYKGPLSKCHIAQYPVKLSRSGIWELSEASTKDMAWWVTFRLTLKPDMDRSFPVRISSKELYVTTHQCAVGFDESDLSDIHLTSGVSLVSVLESLHEFSKELADRSAEADRAFRHAVNEREVGE